MISIELFPCSGGMAKGFRRAGLEFTWAFDWSKEACDSYEANLGHRPVQMDARDLLRLARGGAFHHWVRPAGLGPIDLLVADPPCTPWSRAGKRLGRADERDMLDVTCELIALLRPRSYLIGNIPGLQDSTSWHVVQDAIGGLAKQGYCVADYVSLDAANYGVPQHRVRPFWFGHLDGPCIRWPEPTHADPATLGSLALPGFAPLKPWVTCRDALGHLPLEQLGRPVRIAKRAQDDGKPSATMTSSPARVGAGEAKVLSWPWDRPATTILGDERLSVPGHHDANVGNSSHKGPNAIVLGELAATILQGFPESWQFVAKTKSARWSQLGMAMPPPLAEAVARSVLAQMGASR